MLGQLRNSVIINKKLQECSLQCPVFCCTVNFAAFAIGDLPNPCSHCKSKMLQIW